MKLINSIRDKMIESKYSKEKQEENCKVLRQKYGIEVEDNPIYI